MDSRILSVGSLYSSSKISGNTSNSADLNKSIKSFSQVLQDNLSETNSLQQEADKLTEKFLVGKPVEIHQLMLAMEKADLALRQTVEIRNKLIDAYKEISHMQV